MVFKNNQSRCGETTGRWRMQFSYTEDGWVMYFIVPPPTFALLFLFPQKITSLLLMLLAGLGDESWDPQEQRARNHRNKWN
jgi:hypothetical protein